MLVRVQSKAPFFSVTLADLTRAQTQESKVQFLQALPFLQTTKRVGVNPGQLCAVMRICWISCRDERSRTVSGVKDYPLWAPECQPWSMVHSHTP